MKRLPLALLSATVLVAASACATNGVSRSQADAANLQAYTDSAGAPVSSFHKFGSIHSWESLNDENIVLYSRPRTAYLVNINECPGLDFAQAIRVSDSLGRVQVNFDRVYPLDNSPMANVGCVIRSIRPVDLGKYKTLTSAFQKARIAQ